MLLFNLRKEVILREKKEAWGCSLMHCIILSGKKLKKIWQNVNIHKYEQKVHMWIYFLYFSVLEISHR